MWMWSLPQIIWLHCIHPSWDDVRWDSADGMRWSEENDAALNHSVRVLLTFDFLSEDDHLLCDNVYGWVSGADKIDG